MRARSVRIPFDTLAYTQTLRKAGIDEAYASAHAEALVMAFTQGVATHEDIEELDSKVGLGFTEVRAEMAQGLTEVRAEMAQGLTEVRSEMAQGFTKMRVLVIATLILVALTNPVALHVLHVTGLLH